jgi:hypothetical protein
MEANYKKIILVILEFLSLSAHVCFLWEGSSGTECSGGHNDNKLLFFSKLLVPILHLVGEIMAVNLLLKKHYSLVKVLIISLYL